MNRPPEPPRLAAWQRLFLLLLAVINFWACYTALRRQIVGLVNGALAILLLLLVAVTGTRRGRL